ncbi:DUF402 domain-containing protein [Streptomyces orinoci]|uniref:DUF402 domain-containing protein n=1 Tax=Streptomyces orinoci TaxID=67339 RepID=A0ABV3K4G3_STRON|nr:DUF402 domain-containing protein [Streptomyces orinoci]
MTGIRLRPGREVSVRLVKGERPAVCYPATVVADDGVHLVLRAAWAKPTATDFGVVRFEPGDVLTEHYWRDRWYSVKEVRDAAGTLKGWYCDVTRLPAVGPEGLVTEDLDLDLWLSADGGTVLRLDEDEFAASGLAERDPMAASRAERALDELEILARSGELTAMLSG